MINFYESHPEFEEKYLKMKDLIEKFHEMINMFQYFLKFSLGFYLKDNNWNYIFISIIASTLIFYFNRSMIIIFII